METETIVVIPYLSQEAQGCELELAVEGWRQHFMRKHTIVIVGDHDEAVERLLKGRHGRYIYFIDCPRIAPVEGQYTPHLDHVNKFMRVRRLWPETDGFIYSCDDMYAVKDFTLEDVLTRKKDDRYRIQAFGWKNESGWWRDFGKTMALNEIFGRENENFVCHLPVYYDWDRLMEIYLRYSCDRVSFVVENIYFNLGELESWRDTEPASKYGTEVNTAAPYFSNAEEPGTIWITNSNSGWSKALEDILRRHYNL